MTDTYIAVKLVHVVLIGIITIFLFIIIFLASKRIIRCPVGKILVVYGMVGNNKNFICIESGSKFIWPYFQNYEFLDCTPIESNLHLKKAITKNQHEISMQITSAFTISREPKILENAAERILGLSNQQISLVLNDIVFGQLRQIISTFTLDEIKTKEEILNKLLLKNIENETIKIGFVIQKFRIIDYQLR
jgi:flotillin